MDGRSPTAVDFNKKYRALKKKYKSLSDETSTLTDALTQAKKRIARLHKERSFLLDRLLKYEQVSSDSDSSPSSLSSDEERPRKMARREALAGFGLNRPAVKPRAAPKEKDENSNVQLCIGRGKDDRPCKSKALPGFKHCWHHAPLDPNSPFVFCQYIDTSKRIPKKCSIPVGKEKELPYCNYHVKRIAPQAEGGKVDTISENGEMEPEPEQEGEAEDVEVEGDEGDDINLLSAGEDDISEDEIHPHAVI